MSASLASKIIHIDETIDAYIGQTCPSMKRKFWIDMNEELHAHFVIKDTNLID